MPLLVEAVSWETAQQRCLAIRRAVFIEEQGIDSAIEIDGLDAQCSHVIACLDGIDVGTARMKPDGHIGRVAVLAVARGQGIGAALMQSLCQLARDQGLHGVHLASQESAIGFYHRLGFADQGEPFIEANIPHMNMVLCL